MSTQQMSTWQTSTQPHRLPAGGRIDRDTILTFVVDGVAGTGHPGDTVASALLANGRLRVRDSIHRSRPRGIVTAGAEEPNALLRVADGASEATVLATTHALVDGLVATTVPGPHEPDHVADAPHDSNLLLADVLVVGGGPAGLAAARCAAGSGARVVLLDEQPELGGSLLSSRWERVDGRPALEWVGETVTRLTAAPEVTVLTGTRALDSTDDGCVLAVQDRSRSAAHEAEHLATPARQLWRISARRVVVATGARERPLLFSGNDRPGVMLAGAVRTYINRYAVTPGRKAVVTTTNDSAYDTVEDLLAVGVEVVAVLDARDIMSGRAAEIADRGVRVLPCSTAQGTEADQAAGLLTAVHVGTLDHRDQATCWETLECDLLAVSGGWSPMVPLPGQPLVGAAAGTVTLDDVLREGDLAGAEAATAAGFTTRPLNVGGSAPLSEPWESRDLWLVPAIDGDPGEWDEHFVDLQRDETVADLWRAAGAEMQSADPGSAPTSGLAPGLMGGVMRRLALVARMDGGF